MAKQGTTAATAKQFKAKAGSARHGAGNKNVVHGGRAAGKPSSGGRTKPLKGPDRGGV
ncbi:hypothetical protein Bhz59_00010 [Stenotrophomonas phage vB_SmaS_Bhz59]